MAFTEQEEKEIVKIVKSVVQELIDETARVQAYPITEDVSIYGKLNLQIERCSLYQKLVNEETDAETSTDLEEKLKEMPNVIDSPKAQEVLDAFDFIGASEVASKVGWTYRDGEEISMETLVKDAIKCMETVVNSESKSCRYQLGRIIAYKIYDEYDGAPWYSLTFFAEHSEEY